MGRRFRRILVERESVCYEGDSKVGAFRHGPVKILRQLPVRKGFRFQRGYSVARAIGGVGLIVGSSFVCAENLPVSASVAKPSSAPSRKLEATPWEVTNKW